MSKRKAPDPVAFAKATKRDRGGQRCMTCSDPVVSPIVKKWVVLWKRGETDMSVPQAQKFLATYHGYKGRANTLRHCLTNHHGVGS